MITPSYALTATERVLPRMSLDFTTALLDSRVSITRALNTSTAVNSSGVIATVNANLPRFDYDPTTLACKGLLIEETRTNLVLNSLLNGANLTTQNVTVIAIAHTLSFYGSGTITLSGAHSATVNGTGAYPSRRTLTFTPSAGTLTLTVSGTVQFAQLEIGAFATSFIPTAGASVTRNADVVQMTGTNFSSWWNDTAGTFVVYADMTTLAGNLRTLGLNNSPCAISYISNSSKLSVFDGTIVETTNEPLAGVMYKAATGYNASNKYAVLNAGAQVSAARDASFPITPGSSLQIGSDRGIGSFLCGHVYKLMYYPQLLTAAEMQAFTK